MKEALKSSARLIRGMISRNFFSVLIILFTLPVTNQSVASSAPGSLTVIVTADPQEICQGVPSQLNAIASGGTQPYAYLWYPSTGLNDTTIPDPVATPLESTWYHVRVIDAMADTVVDSVLIIVIASPPSPGTIFGPASVCVNSSTGYTINPVTGATSYSWTVPAGAVITEGQNTPSVIILWDTTGGNVSVIAGNNCGLSNPAVLPVSMFRPPAVPAVIYGPDDLCENVNTVFSVDELPEIQSYFWTVPPGTYITAGQGTHSISALWGPESGNVSVVTQNPCGNSAPKNKPVITDTVPSVPDTVTGSDTVCRSHTGYVYATILLPNTLSYKWVLPPGAEIEGISDTNTIVVNFSSIASSGNLTVYGMNNCGVGPGRTKYITVTDCQGIADNYREISFTVAFDPAAKTLVVSFGETLEHTDLKIFGIAGIEIYSANLNRTLTGDTERINLSSCSPGMYILKLSSGNRVCARKFIIR